MKKYFSLLLLTALFALQSCVRVNTVGGSFKRLDVEEFKAFIADSTVQLVDVRTAEEYAEGHLPGSINIDGASAIRRTCSLSLIAKELNINDFYWGLKSKFKLEVGIKNSINPQYPNIIWFQ